jgi:hypothetical protein
MELLRQIIESWAGRGELPAEFWAGVLAGLWPRLAGDRLAPLSRPGALADGVLEVHVKNRYWKTQLDVLEAEIIRRIGDFIPVGVVRRLHLKLSPERFSEISPAARRPGATGAAPADPDWEVRCTAAITNPRLRAAFTRALAARRRE